MQSEAVEKYLKTIYEIQQHGGRVKTTALAQMLYHGRIGNGYD